MFLIRWKGEPQNGDYKKTKNAKFSEKRTFLLEKRTSLTTSSEWKKISRFCFLVTTALRFALSPTCDDIIICCVPVYQLSPNYQYTHIRMRIRGWEMFVFLKISRANFSCVHCFEIFPFALLLVIYCPGRLKSLVPPSFRSSPSLFFYKIIVLKYFFNPLENTDVTFLVKLCL